jgi:hypothetical protein
METKEGTMDDKRAVVSVAFGEVVGKIYRINADAAAAGDDPISRMYGYYGPSRPEIAKRQDKVLARYGLTRGSYNLELARRVSDGYAWRHNLDAEMLDGDPIAWWEALARERDYRGCPRNC